MPKRDPNDFCGNCGAELDARNASYWCSNHQQYECTECLDSPDDSVEKDPD